MSEGNTVKELKALGEKLKAHGVKLDNHYRNVERKTDSVLKSIEKNRWSAVIVAVVICGAFALGTYF